MNRWLAVLAFFVPTTAGAHIHLTYPLSRTDAGTGDQKDQHCGVIGYDRNAHPERVTTFSPGQTITVTWEETIQHPGWFRIAFQPNGEIFGIPPAGNGPAGGTNMPSNFPDQPQLGLDTINGSTVLVDRIADGLLSQSITLPNVECANCTLQFIQVMTDKPPYSTDANSDDIYFNCADIILSSNAPDAGPSTSPDAAVSPGVDAGTSDTEVSGGCATGASTPGLALALALVGLGRRRRRR